MSRPESAESSLPYYNRVNNKTFNILLLWKRVTISIYLAVLLLVEEYIEADNDVGTIEGNTLLEQRVAEIHSHEDVCGHIYIK